MLKTHLGQLFFEAHSNSMEAIGWGIQSSKGGGAIYYRLANLFQEFHNTNHLLIEKKRGSLET
jgi:hypothetical protein